MIEYSQGICEDGAAILCDGQPLTIEEILQRLSQRDELLAALKEITAYWKDAESFTETDREAAKTTYEIGFNVIAKCEAQS